MRQICIHVPEERCYDVVDCLQTECGLRSITKNTEDGIVQLSCLVDDHSSGYVMYQLDKIGCGVAYGKIVLIPVSVVKPLPRGNAPVVNKANTWYKQLASAKAIAGPLGSLLPLHARQSEQQELRNKFSRLAVEEIYSVVDGGCSMSADYFSYILVGSMIAAVGLTTNNAVMIVASMLVSPLMGPILGFTYGTAIWDLSLIRRGVLAEMAGVGVTALIGFLAGLIISGWQDVPDKYDWPTPEMASRGDKASLLVGIFFAVPSGVGVALSATQGGVNSLVGVAIAASLLPPVVNVGLCLAFALVGNDGRNDSQTYFDISGLSLVLFLLNIAVIYVVCMCVFRIKKIAPVRRQLSRYQELPLIKAINPEAASPDGIAPEAVGPPRVVVATTLGPVPTPNGSPSVPGTMIELRTVPQFVAQKLMDEQPNPDTGDATTDEKKHANAAHAVRAASERLSALAQRGDNPLADTRVLGEPCSSGNSSISSSQRVSLDVDGKSTSELRLLEHMQGKPKGGGVVQGHSCDTAHVTDPVEGPLTGQQHHHHAVHAVHAVCTAHDGTRDMHESGRTVIDNPLAARSFRLPMPPDVTAPAQLEDPFEALGGVQQQQEQQLVQQVQQQQQQQQQQEQVVAQALSAHDHQAQLQQHSSSNSAQQAQQQRQASKPLPQQQQQRFLHFNEWTLDDSTLEEWASEVVRTPESITSASLPKTRSTSGQLMLKEEQEAQLRARWRRLVESHFGVKLEDVQECDEEEEEERDSSGKRRKPVFEKKFQSFLKKLNAKLPHSASSSSLSSYARSSLSSKPFTQDPNKAPPAHTLSSSGISITTPSSAATTQQSIQHHTRAPGVGGVGVPEDVTHTFSGQKSPHEDGSAHSFGSSAFVGPFNRSSSSSTGVGGGAGAGLSVSAGVGLGGRNTSEAATGNGSDLAGGGDASSPNVGGDAAAAAAAAAAAKQNNVGSGGVGGALAEGRVTRNSTEAWDLVRKAVVSMHHQRQPEGSSSTKSSRRSSRRNSASNTETGKKGA